MSWLFGMNQRPQDFSQYVPPAPSGDQGGAGGDSDDGKGRKSGGPMEAYRFDSSALERAAKAAKDLEKSGVHNKHSVTLTQEFHNLKYEITVLVCVCSDRLFIWKGYSTRNT